MKKFFLSMAGVIGLVFLTACGKQLSTQIIFDAYQMTRFLDDKIYHQKPIANSGEHITMYQAQEEGTGISNSLVINKVPMMSGVSLSEIVNTNMQQLQSSLQNYKIRKSQSKTFTCGETKILGQYSNFAYTLDQSQIFYVGQYFFVADNTLYLLSFHSINAKDINSFDKSIKTIICK